MAPPRVLFRFDSAKHEYIDLATGAVLPHTTGMLQRTGWVDDTWFTDESSERGSVVHQLTAEYDLEALDVASCVSPHRGYLLAHVEAMTLLRPEILAVEEPVVHPVHRYGCRPDRVVRLDRALGVLEVKAAAPADSHRLQTALQAIAVAPDHDLEPEMLRRWCLYLKPNGKWTLEEHLMRSDFLEARKIIRKCCGGA